MVPAPGPRSLVEVRGSHAAPFGEQEREPEPVENLLSKGGVDSRWRSKVGTTDPGNTNTFTTGPHIRRSEIFRRKLKFTKSNPYQSNLKASRMLALRKSQNFTRT